MYSIEWATNYLLFLLLLCLESLSPTKKQASIFLSPLLFVHFPLPHSNLNNLSNLTFIFIFICFIYNSILLYFSPLPFPTHTKLPPLPTPSPCNHHCACPWVIFLFCYYKTQLEQQNAKVNLESQENKIIRILIFKCCFSIFKHFLPFQVSVLSQYTEIPNCYYLNYKWLHLKCFSIFIFYYISFLYHLSPFYLLPLTSEPSPILLPTNHHTVVHIYESFFFFAPSGHYSTPPHHQL